VRGDQRHPRSLWVEECLGLSDRKKFFTFLLISERDPAFAAELPAFVSEIRRIFSAEEVHEYLDHLKRAKFLAPQEGTWRPMISTKTSTKNRGWRTLLWAPRSYCVSACSAALALVASARPAVDGAKKDPDPGGSNPRRSL
jgi:hypothetical protein